MTNIPNEALIKVVSQCLADHWNAEKIAEIEELIKADLYMEPSIDFEPSLAEEWIDEAQTIIPIVQKAVKDEVVTFLKSLPQSVMHVTEGHTDLVSLVAPGREGAQYELRSFLAHVAEFIERDEHRKT